MSSLKKWFEKLARFITALQTLLARRIFPNPIHLIRYLKVRHLSRFQGPRRAFLTVAPGNAGSLHLAIRGNTTDANVLWDTFIERYHCMGARLQPGCTVLDLGSNIGLTCLDFAETFQATRVIGVEMAPDNFRMAAENCRPYPQIELLEGAVWSQTGQVSFQKSYGEWGYAVSEQASQQAKSYSLVDIFERFHLNHVHFVKMDIEGAEGEVLDPDRSDLSWLDKVEQMQVELHPPICFQRLAAVLENHGFQCTLRQQGCEYLIAVRNEPLATN